MNPTCVSFLVRRVVPGILVLAAASLSVSAAESPLHALRARRDAFSKLVREKPFEQALAALEPECASKDDLTRSAALEAKAELLARRDVRKRWEEVRAVLAAAREASRAAEARLPAGDAAALAERRLDLRFEEARLARFLPDGCAESARVYRDLLAENPPPDCRARALHLLAFQLMSRPEKEPDKRRAALREACALLEDCVARHPRSPVRHAALLRLSEACFAEHAEPGERSFDGRESLDRYLAEWEAARQRALELADQVLKEGATGPLADRARGRKGALSAISPDPVAENGGFRFRTSSEGVRQGPAWMPAAGAAVPGEDLSGWEGAWTLTRVPSSSLDLLALAKGEDPETKGIEPQARGRAAPGHAAVPLQGKGLHILVREGPRTYSEKSWIVSDLLAVAKVSLSGVHVLALDRPTFRPAEGCAAVLRWRTLPGADWVQAEGRTGADGVAFFGLALPQGAEEIEVQYGVRRGEDVAVGSAWVSDGSGAREYRYHWICDRPIYKPGETVQFLCLVRFLEGDEFLTTSGEEYRLGVYDHEGRPLFKETLRADESGAMAGEFALGESVALGTAWVRIEPVKPRCVSFNAEMWIEGWDGWVEGVAPKGGQFEIQAYRRPEAQVRVSHPRAVYGAGERVTVAVEAEYYHGGPVAGAQGTLIAEVFPSIRENPLDADPWREFWGDRGDFYEVGSMTIEIEFQTDSRGRAEVVVPAETWGMEEADFDIRVKVADAAERESGGQAKFRVCASDLYLYAKAAASSVAPGTALCFRLAARDAAGSPVRAEGTARLFRLGGGEAGSAPFATLEDGSGTVAFPAQPPGRYGLVLEAKGGARANSAPASVEVIQWRRAQGEGGKPAARVLAIRTDRKTYGIGDTAAVSVDAPGLTGTVWLTLQSGGVALQKVLPVLEGCASCSIPLGRESVPNAFVHALYFGEAGLHVASVPVLVKDPADALRVQIDPDRPAYGASSEATLRLRVTDGTGKPRAGRLALAVVDRSLFDLVEELPPPLPPTFRRPRRPDAVETTCEVAFDSENCWSEPQSALAGPAFCEEEPAPEREIQVRRDFRPLACWRPILRTDAQGFAEVKFRFSDLLTRWKIRADALAGASSFGTSEGEMRTAREMVVRVAAPRLFREGDRVAVPVTVGNLGIAARDVRLTLEARGAKIEGASERAFRVEPGAEGREVFILEDFTPGDVVLKAVARGGPAGDAVEFPVPCDPRGMRRTAGFAGLVRAGGAAEIELPNPPASTPEALQVFVAGDLASVVREALPFLEGYPYGCTEQTLSRFVPALVAWRSLKAAGIADPGFEARLPDMVRAGLRRLYDLQRADGGWGWWGFDETRPWLTACVAAGLADAKRAGFEVREGVLARARLRLVDVCRSDAEEPQASRAFHRYALVSLGGAEVPDLDDLARDPGALGPFALSYLVLALKQAGREEPALACARALAARAERQGDFAAFSDPWEHWSASRVHLNAVALQALLRTVPDDPAVPGLIATLLADRSGPAWASTLDTARAVLALSEVSSTGLAPRGELSYRLLADGRPHSEGRGAGPWRVDADPRAARPARLRIENRSGEASLFYSVDFRYWTGDAALEPEGELNVGRNVTVLRSASGGELEEGPALDRMAELREGDLVRVRVGVVAASGRPIEQVVIEVPGVSCLEPLVRDERGEAYAEQGVRAEFRDRAAVFFVNWLPEGGQEIAFDARVERAGRFRFLPVRAHAMYTPSLSGTSGDGSFVAVPREEAAAAPSNDAARVFEALKAELEGETGDFPMSKGEMTAFLCRSDHEPFWEWLSETTREDRGALASRFPCEEVMRGIARRSGVSTREGLKAFFENPVAAFYLDSEWRRPLPVHAIGVPGPGPEAVARLADVLLGLPPGGGGARAAGRVFATLRLIYAFPHLQRLLEGALTATREGRAGDALPLWLALDGFSDGDLCGGPEVARQFSPSGEETRTLRFAECGIPSLEVREEAWKSFLVPLGAAVGAVPGIRDSAVRGRAAEALAGNLALAREFSSLVKNAGLGPEAGNCLEATDRALAEMLGAVEAWIEDPASALPAARMLGASEREDFWDRLAGSPAGSDPEVLRALAPLVRPLPWQTRGALVDGMGKAVVGLKERIEFYHRLARFRAPDLAEWLKAAALREKGPLRIEALAASFQAGMPLDVAVVEEAARGETIETMKDMFGRLRSLGPDFSLRLVFALMRQGLPFGHAAMFLQSIGTPEAADALLAIAREDPAKAGVALAGAAEGMQDPDPREGRKPWAPGGLQALLDILDSMRPCPAAIREDLLARLRLEEWFCRTARPEDARLLGERLRSAKQTDERFLFAAVLCRLKPAGEKTWWESSPLEGEAGELVRDLVLLSLGAGGAAGRVKAALESCETGWKRAAARCLARAGTAEALAILEVLFDDPEESVREQVADALAGAGAEGLRALLSRLGPASLQGAFDRIQSRKEALDREALEKFVQTVVDSELEDEHAKDLLRESAGALARKGPPPGPRLAAWLEEAAAGKKTARQERLVVLVEFLRGGIPEEDCPAGWLPLIEKQLESEDWSRRNWALTRLTNMAPEADAALVKALDSRFPDAAWQSARILYVRTAKVHAWKRADGSKKDLVPDVHLEYEHLLFLLRQGRYHEVLDQARGPDAEWSRLAKEALEDSLGEMPEPR